MPTFRQRTLLFGSYRLVKRSKNFAKTYGFARLLECLFWRIFYILLKVRYGIPQWAMLSPYSCKEYKIQTVSLASRFKPEVVVDLGCGLGDIVARVDAKRRYGLDIDDRLLKAAHFLFSSKVTFRKASIFDPDSIRDAVSEAQIDLLIMTGWAHGCPFEKFLGAMKNLTKVQRVNKILLDTWRLQEEEMVYCYTGAELKRLGKVLFSIDGGDSSRDLHVIELDIAG